MEQPDRDDQDVSDEESSSMSYEDLREKKIRENKAMMAQLGLTSLVNAWYTSF
jgi:hypothetical protein